MTSFAHRLLSSGRMVLFALLLCGSSVSAQSSNPCAALASFSGWKGQVTGTETGNLTENQGSHVVSDNQQGTFRYTLTTRASDVDPFGDPFTFGGDTLGDVTINNSDIYYLAYPPGSTDVETTQFSGSVSYPLGNMLDNATLSFTPAADGKNCTYIFHFPAIVQGVTFKTDDDSNGEHQTVTADADWLDDVFPFPEGNIDADTFYLAGYLLLGKVAPDATGISRTATFSTQLGGIPRNVTLAWALQPLCQPPGSNGHSLLRDGIGNGRSLEPFDSSGPGCTPNIDVIMSAFIPPETVDGPGLLYAPLVNAEPDLKDRLVLAYAGALSGISCIDLGRSGLLGLPNFRAEPLKFAGNNRSFDPNATSYKLKETFSLNTNEAKYPDGKAVDPEITTTDSRSYAPNSFAGGHLTATAKAASVPSKPRCNLLFDKAAPNLSLIPVPDISRADNKITAHIEAQTSDPLIVNTSALVAGLPNLLDYASPFTVDMTLTVDALTNTFTLKGMHSCFPAFELYLNKTAVYTFSPASSSLSEVTKCLAFRSDPITVDASGQVPVQ